MKLNNFILLTVVIFALNNCTYAKEKYVYLDIKECSIPIKPELKLVNTINSSYLYEEEHHNFLHTLKSPISIIIEENNNFNQKSIDKIIRLGNLKKIIIKKDNYQIFSDNKKENNVFLIILKKHSIMTVNYTGEDINFILNSCIGIVLPELTKAKLP